MSTHKPHPIEVGSQRIQETLEHKPDRDEVEYWSSDLMFKLEKLHYYVSDLQGELAEMKGQVDDLQYELAEVKGQVDDLHSEDR
jgi:peptidoglycan hydrolase CwlO-like protein